MKVEAVNPNELASQYYYLEQKGLNGMFTPSAVEDNSGDRAFKDAGWRAQDLQFMLGKLNLSQNKFFIIRLLKRGDVINILYMLDKEKLVQAMNLFPRTKLIHFLFHLPKEMLLKMLLWVIPLRTFMQFFPTETIFNLLRSQRLDVSSFVRGFENQPPEMLQKLMMLITGQNTDGLKHKELLAMLRQLRKEQIVEGMKGMGQKDIFEFVFAEVKKDPELLMMISRGDLIKVTSLMPKPNLVEMFQLLPEQMLVQYLSQLPEKELCMAAAQVDDKSFGNMLINDFPDLIASLAQAAA